MVIALAQENAFATQAGQDQIAPSASSCQVAPMTMATAKGPLNACASQAMREHSVKESNAGIIFLLLENSLLFYFAVISRPGCNLKNGYCDGPNQCWCKPGWSGPTCNDCVKYPGCVNGFCTDPWECR